MEKRSKNTTEYSEKKEKESYPKTKGGFEYKEASGLKIRKSIRPDRIKEDDETYEEYKMRRKMKDDAISDHMKGTLVWSSVDYTDPGNRDKNLGTYNKEELKELDRELKKKNNK